MGRRGVHFRVRHARNLFSDVGVGESGTKWKVEYMAARKYWIPHGLPMDYTMSYPMD